MRYDFQLLVFILSLLSYHSSHADVRLDYDQYKMYADTANLTFAELSSFEEKVAISFVAYDGLSTEVQYYWIKLESSVLKGAEYVFFSNFLNG